MITDKGLRSIGFTVQFLGRVDGFYTQDIDGDLYFTVDFKTLSLSLNKQGYGHIKRFKNITTIEQINNLLLLLSD